MDTRTRKKPTVSRVVRNETEGGKNRISDFVKNDDMNSWLEGFHLLRAQWLQAIIDPRRDIDKECGYPYVIIPKQYRFMYDREGVASRVVNIFPDECWAVNPLIYEVEDTTKTPFEEDIEELCNQASQDNILHYCHRIDRLSGIGRYGTLLLGLDDNKDMSEPVDGIDEFGRPTGESTNLKLLFLRPFDEISAQITRFEKDPQNPRFGQPLYYHVFFSDPRVGGPGLTASSASVSSRIVHWSRIIHVADNRETGEIFGVPRQQTVFNRECDLRKCYGGSAEMFWRGGFPGYAFELNPDLVTSGITLDQKSLEEQFERYSNGLQRYLSVVGLQTKTLAPQVADPEHSIMVQLNAIAIAIGAPLRVFMGSEQAQLASGQDIRTWNRRLHTRRERYISPFLLRPLVDRLIAFGVVRKPKKRLRNGTYDYKIHWPDVNIPTEEERAKNFDRVLAGLMKYVIGACNQVVAPYELLTMPAFGLGLTIDEADAVMKGLKNNKIKIVPPVKPGKVIDEGQTDESAKSTAKAGRTANDHG